MENKINRFEKKLRKVLPIAALVLSSTLFTAGSSWAQAMVMGPAVQKKVTDNVATLMKNMGAKPEMAEMMGQKYSDSFKRLYDKMGRGEALSDSEMSAIAGMMSTMASMQK